MSDERHRPTRDRRAPRARAGDFRLARTAAALSLVGLVCALAVLDALSADYRLELPTLALILGAAAGFLSVEIRDILSRK